MKTDKKPASAAEKPKEEKPGQKKSIIAALLALSFFGGLFAVGLSDPPVYLILIYSGILVSSVLTIYYWRAERRNGAKASSIVLWIVAAILIAFLLLCLLPAFS